MDKLRFPIETIRFAWTWLRRLPNRFVLLLLPSLAGFAVPLVLFATPGRLEGIVTGLLARMVPGGLPAWLPDPVASVLERAAPAVEPVSEFAVTAGVGALSLALLLFALLLAYNLSAFLYRRIRKRPSVRVAGPAGPEAPAAGRGDGGGGPDDRGRLDEFRRIGLILAGGGAKGAYQAGALRAIHEFLEEHGALDRVAMVAGTSIGSWNALFWLAGLVEPPEGDGRSVHERWWRRISLEGIVEFDSYWPLTQNHFLRSTPWQEAFREIFVDPPEVRGRLARLFPGPDAEGADGGPPVHFYLTRSNVELGQLEFATNWAGLREETRPRLGVDEEGARAPLVDPDLYEVIEGPDVEEALRRTRRAVFASMDLPPLFPYRKIRVGRTEWFENGGVVNNLPVRFGTQVENCDLLFVLPLNASFAEPVDHRSVTRRLFRVMDVRQGVMERRSMKMIYLYNELAELRGPVQEQRAAGAASRLERTARRREHEPVAVFSIVPEAPLALGTAEFWKADAAGEAFDLLYDATRAELAENFERDTDPNWIRMTRVGPLGERTHFDDF